MQEESAVASAETELWLAPERVIAGRYRLLSKLGAGGMGSVWRAQHMLTEQKVALKVVQANVLASERSREMFRAECAAPGRIGATGPGLACFAQIYDADIDPTTGVGYIAMEVLSGADLESILRKEGRLAPDLVIRIAREVCRGLDLAHRSNYVHRDIKPANLFLTESVNGIRAAKILDWGIARVEGPHSSLEQTMVCGTPPYMAPEQYQGDGCLDGRADLYSLALTVYELLVGKHYFAREIWGGGGRITHAVVAKGTVEPASKRALAHGVLLPRAFDAWFRQATALDPGGRFVTGAQLSHALAEVFRPGWHKPALWVTCALGSILLGAVGWYLAVPAEKPAVVTEPHVTLPAPKGVEGAPRGGAEPQVVVHVEAPHGQPPVQAVGAERADWPQPKAAPPRASAPARKRAVQPRNEDAPGHSDTWTNE